MCVDTSAPVRTESTKERPLSARQGEAVSQKKTTQVHLQYGAEDLTVELPSGNVTVIEPKRLPGLDDEAAAFREAVRSPIESRPLRDHIYSSDHVAIVIPDITRPLPTDRVLPWLFEELDHVPPERFTIINGTGSHRANTLQELSRMVGADILERYRVINHDANDEDSLVRVGTDLRGHVIHFNREYAEADKRIVLGFIEPHFMAGFSGGYKGVFPAVADIEAIMRYHDAETISDPKSTWGVLNGNPTQITIRHNGALLPVDFCINVTLNRDREITRFFCGETRAVHKEGSAFAREQSMASCAQAFPVVITTNSGYPLDQNLYQSVKGMSAASMIVEDGGYILAASECRDGFPDHGNFKQLLLEHTSPESLLEKINTEGFLVHDQWEAQILAMIVTKARVGLYSQMPEEDVRKAYVEPVTDIAARVAEELTRIGEDAPIAVLPEGPQTIPYLE